MQLFDTHTHLTMEPLAGQVSAVLDRSRQAGVAGWISIGTTMSDCEAGLDMAEQYESLWCTVGIHPHGAGQVERGYLDTLREWLRKDRVVALGEMGLDYHYDFSDRASQRRVFAEQLELAEEMGLPAVVHCREAFEDVLGIWRERGREDGGVVFHCFSGGCDEARAVLDGGGWISFTGTITFRNAGELQEVARYVPLERILLETDCPYLSPEPKRNVKPNEPALLVHTAEKLAELRGVPVEEIAQATVANSRSFFGIDS